MRKLNLWLSTSALWLTNSINAFAADDFGATAIEYGLIAGLIAVVVIGAVSQLGTSISAKFSAIAGNLS